MYKKRRKDPELVLFTSLAGFFGVAGIHRFFLGQMVMGLIFFFTLGFCGIGTIVDLFMHKQITNRHNKAKADDVAYLIRHVIDVSSEEDDLFEE